MTITITPPLGTPTNLSANVIVGGNLDASTTYYWKVLAQNSSATYFVVSNLLRSDWSAEGTFVTTADNKQVELSWDAVTGATHYVVLLSKVSGNYVGSTRLGSAQGTATTDTNSYTATANPTGQPYTFYMLSETTYPIPGGLDRSKGRILVNFDGTVTLQNIYDQIVSDGYGAYCYYDGVVFVLNGSFYITKVAGSGSLSIKGKHLYLLGLFSNASDSGVTVTFGESLGNTTASQSILTMLYINAGWSMYSNMVFNGGAIQALLTTGVTSAYVFGDIRSYPSGAIFNGVFIGQGINMTLNYAHVGNTTTQSSGLFLTSSIKLYDIKFQNPDVVYGYSLFANSGLGWGKTFRGIYDSMPKEDFLVYCNSLTTVPNYQYDPSFNYRKANLPLIYWYAANGSNVWAPTWIYHSLLLRVIDSSGNAISNALVSAVDTAGAGELSDTTNTDGYVLDNDFVVDSATSTVITVTPNPSWTTNVHLGKEIIMTSGDNAGQKMTIISNTGNTLTLMRTLGATCSNGDRGGILPYLKRCNIDHKEGVTEAKLGEDGQTITYKTPHTITISKSGYQTKTIKYTMDRKREEIEALEKVKDLNYSKRGRLISQ